ncbi:uncharacterized protein HMPREF1541_10463 [Cyphellophora europaea CBS 101466]|uniref:Glucoamylase n=1 Tax=Cyphellophora europaea (strain CBS 101466) TaxID=1220924 RepID=W2S899_CYPE1|nr:uncharacterized protein HMPREF1541_10463 [Cyphellophora europaea CBS 101466]ETN44283.1 hypothetical protein HMPREF1541_10463 [Cyphellophora europaea CBS 101466]
MKALALSLVGIAAASPFLRVRQNNDLESFIERQRNLSLPAVLRNIGGLNDSDVDGANPGIVVASPSTVNPNYFYTWTRDSALTYLMITDELLFGTERVGNNSLQVVIEDYTTAQAILQTVTNPSGSLWPAGAGLGEPKFYTNKTRFNGAWGRPQNDGPALRASAFIEATDAIFVRAPNASEIVANVYWPIILNDLNYVGQYWNTSSYDLWEEVNGNSFFTTTAQHRALVQGSILAEKLNQTCEPCQQAPEILCFLQNNFWNETGNYLLANINTNQVTRSEVNIDPILAAMHAFDINATCDAAALQPCNSRTLATHKVVIDSFRNLYPINENATAPTAVAVGRYPEDTYYTGNPWYITTLAAAEVLYDAIAQFRKNETLTVDETSLDFFTDLYPNATVGSYDGDDLENILDAVMEYADGFVEVVQKYTPENGTLNEQINKTTGEPTSAIALTWSFAAFITMAERRDGQFPPSWGASSELANNSTETCAASSYNATYSYQVAAAAGAPQVGTPRCMKEVLFVANYSSAFGNNLYIVGNNTLFGGDLMPELPIQVMRTGNKTETEPLSIVPAWVISPQTIEYRYVLQNETAGTYTFENKTMIVEVGPCDGEIQRVDDSPAFPGQ